MKKLLAPIVLAVAIFFVVAPLQAQAQCVWNISQTRDFDDSPDHETTCFEDGTTNSCLIHNEPGLPLTVRVEGIEYDGELVERQSDPDDVLSGLAADDVQLDIEQRSGGGERNYSTKIDQDSPGLAIFDRNVRLDDIGNSTADWTFTINVRTVQNQKIFWEPTSNDCSISFTTYESCSQNQCVTERADLNSNDWAPFAICEQIPEDSDLRNECEDCAGGISGQQGVWTAIGCVDRNPEAILRSLLSTGLTIGGGVALLMILGAGFIFTTSSGDPKRVDQAKEMITSAVIGLIFIIFSVTILEFIGFTVLRIPGFGG